MDAEIICDICHKKFIFSEITNSNISPSEYEFVKKTWKEKEWKTLKDMLIYYNVMDCKPFVEAVGKMLHPYLAQGIDILKSSFSVSGVAKIQMLQRCEKEAFFYLFPKRHADLYHTLRSNITGGLSIKKKRFRSQNFHSKIVSKTSQQTVSEIKQDF